MVIYLKIRVKVILLDSVMEALHMITFHQVTKEFSDGTKGLDDISVNIPSRKLTAVIGPSGCGKTTLLKTINRLENLTSGKISINEKDIKKTDPVQLRRSIGYVIQRIGLLPHYTIAENIALVPTLLGWDKQKIKDRVDELLRLVDLEPATYRKRYPLELSGGQQQRIGVARALASDPDIILMDEPFSALDPISREQLQVQLKDLQEKIQKTIVFVTHDMDEALDIADEIILMKDGKIEQAGTPIQLLQEPKNEFVAQFIGEERVYRRLGFAKRKLKDFSTHFLQTTEKATRPIAADASLKEALEQLTTNEALAVTEAEKTIGYITERTLLEIAFKGSEHHE